METGIPIFRQVLVTIVILLEIENLGLPNKLGLLSMKARDTKENLFGNLQGSSILGNKTNMETSVPSQE